MALAQIYSANGGDTITAARWNNEFGNIYTNGTDVAFPVTKAVSFAGFTLTLDVAGVSTLTSTSSTGFALTVGAKSGTPSANGSLGFLSSSTFTDTNTAVSGTAALYTAFSIRTPTLAASAATVTTTKAASLYVEAAPIAGTNETLTNAYALYVDAGKVQLDGDLQVEGTVNFNGTVTGSGTVILPATDPYLLTNINITTSVAANALTIAVKTAAGTDPSTSDPVYVRVRNATLSTSGTVQRSITAATSLVISSGSTLGTVSAQAHRLYIGLLDNSGTLELFIYNPLSGSNLKGLVESALLTTTAEGGAGGADTAQVAYSTSARSNVPFRVIGFIEITEATAGTWATAPSTVQELQPWMPRTGHLVGFAIGTNGTASGSLTTVIPLDDTKPQSSEGSQIATVSYSPVSACNLIQIQGQAGGLMAVNDPAGATTITTAIFTNLSTDSLTAESPLMAEGAAQTTPRGNSQLFVSSATLGTMTSAQIRGGWTGTVGGSWRYNNSNTVDDYGASVNSYISVREIMV